MRWQTQAQTPPNGRVSSSAALLALAASLLASALPAQQVDPTAPTPSFLLDGDEGSVAARLAALRRARNTLMGIRDFNSALNPATAAVAAQEQDKDPDYANDVAMLARVQTELRDFAAAESNYLKAIDLIAAAEGEFSVTLIDAYRALGRSYITDARYPEAIVALEQAQHVNQRNLGLFNVEQAPLIDDITTAYLGLGDTLEARRMQLERLDNAVRRFGADDPRVFPYRYVLAEYYQRSRLPLSAREQYEAVLKSQETRLDATDPALLEPLRRLAKIDLLLGQGEDDEAYNRLVTLLEQNPSADPAERGLCLALLGDWATVTGDPTGAQGYYHQAWDALSTKPDFNPTDFFATPVMLDFVAPLNPVDRGARSRPYAWGQIVFRFDVSPDGRPSNVEVVGSNAPAGQLETRYGRRLRETHFRPRLVAGEPRATTNVEFTHYFRYYVDEG